MAFNTLSHIAPRLPPLGAYLACYGTAISRVMSCVGHTFGSVAPPLAEKRVL